MREHAMSALEPTIWHQGEGVERLVRILVRPAVEQNPRRASGFVARSVNGDEHEVRGGADINTAEAELDPADEIEPFHEDGALVEFARAGGVFDDQDAISGLARGKHGAG